MQGKTKLGRQGVFCQNNGMGPGKKAGNVVKTTSLGVMREALQFKTQAGKDENKDFGEKKPGEKIPKEDENLTV